MNLKDKCKALQYWEKIDNRWYADTFNRFKKDFDKDKAIGYKQMDKFIENSNIFFGRDGGDMYEAIDNYVRQELTDQYNDVELGNMLLLPIPSFLAIDKNNNIIHYDEDPNYDGAYWEYVDGKINDRLCDIQIAYDIGGKSAIKELQKNTNIDERIFNYFLKQKTNAYMERKLYYGDDTMFVKELSKLNANDEITVYWVDGTMYVNDESDNQATTESSLFESYQFAVLIEAVNYDYTASDNEVKQLSEQMLDLIDETHYAINVWDYLDDISDNFRMLTGKIINDIDTKRAIVCYMTEVDTSDYPTNSVLRGFGSATYIAKILWDNIMGNKEKQIPKCNNKVAIDLANQYLSPSEYDLREFANALNQKCESIDIEINGALWVNSAKYEYVDKIIITEEEVDIYWKEKRIGSILRENIETLCEQNYEENIITDLLENMAYILDITKKGDL